MKNFKGAQAQKLIDIILLMGLGLLLLKYAVTGELRLLINPNYTSLVWVSGILLIVVGGNKISELFFRPKKMVLSADIQHLAIISPIWSSFFLLLTIVLGFLIPPQVLTSQTALSRGISDSALLTRSQPELFRTFSKPENRSLVDWVRTLNAYPEPDAYRGQLAKISGFVIHSPKLPGNYILLSRFVITCCAVDAYPVGIPVRLSANNKIYPDNTWLEISGLMEPDMLDKHSQLVLFPKTIKIIPTPSDPYNYSGN